MKYNIPLSTLKNKKKGLHSGTIGRQKVFSDEEEACFAQHLMKLADYGFPVDELDLWMVIKSYLDKQGRRVQGSLITCLELILRLVS